MTSPEETDMKGIGRCPGAWSISAGRHELADGGRVRLSTSPRPFRERRRAPSLPGSQEALA